MKKLFFLVIMFFATNISAQEIEVIHFWNFESNKDSDAELFLQTLATSEYVQVKEIDMVWHRNSSDGLSKKLIRIEDYKNNTLYFSIETLDDCYISSHNIYFVLDRGGYSEYKYGLYGWYVEKVREKLLEFLNSNNFVHW